MVRADKNLRPAMVFLGIVWIGFVFCCYSTGLTYTQEAVEVKEVTVSKQYGKGRLINVL